MNRFFTSLAVAVFALGSVVAGWSWEGERASVKPSAQDAAPAKGSPTWATGGKRERWTPDNCAFAFVDHQTGLMSLVHNAPPTEFKNIVVGLAKLAKLHNVPTVLTTSAETGPNGPMLPEIIQLLPNAPKISRPGQINAWDNADFVDAIKKTGRKKIVMSGITTDVCVTFAALSALDAGYEVYVVVDASGCMNTEVQHASIERMSQAGAIIGTWFGICCELLYDWRNPGGPGSAQLFIEHMPSYGEVFASHKAASAGPKSGGDKK
jgi:nicotinamidase-related amidase